MDTEKQLLESERNEGEENGATEFREIKWKGM